MASKRSQTDSTLLAKGLHLVYGYPGELLVGWEAQPLDKDQYLVKRSDGSTRVMMIGEQVKVRERGGLEPSTAIVNRSDSGVLMVGNKSVIIGKDFLHGHHARSLGKTNSYQLMNDKNCQVGRVTIGESVGGQPVSLVDGHLLKVGESIYPITPKKYEITLLVMKKAYEGGYLSYINIVEKGNQMNRKDGAKGALIPPRHDGEPARFMEIFGGKIVVTAMFWLEANGKKLSYQFRDGAAALHQLNVENELHNARNLALESGLEPEELAEYVTAAAELENINKQWAKESMGVIEGAQYFKPHDPRRTFQEAGLSPGL